eukprot:5358-Heterococcus_DN1.PRE.2
MESQLLALQAVQLLATAVNCAALLLAVCCHCYAHCCCGTALPLLLALLLLLLLQMCTADCNKPITATDSDCYRVEGPPEPVRLALTTPPAGTAPSLTASSGAVRLFPLVALLLAAPVAALLLPAAACRRVPLLQ